MAEEKCIRCGRAAPAAGSAEYGEWEKDEDGYLICLGCLSGEESRWVAEEADETARRQAAEVQEEQEHSEGGDA
jgi:hypothetical protein